MTRIERASVVGLGTSRLRSANGGLDRGAAVRLLREALDAGITLYDTANIYGQGDAERAIGEAFAGQRDKVVIATKVGHGEPAAAGTTRRLKPLLRAASQLGPVKRLAHSARTRASAAQVPSGAALLTAVERSLERLRTDHVDVLYLHNPGDPGSDDRLDMLGWAKQQGLCRHVGVAVASFEEAAAWLGTSVPTIAQVPCGLDRLALAQPVHGTLIGREAFSAGELLNPRWVTEQLEHAPPERLPDLDINEPMSYLSWLTRGNVVDHLLVGTTDKAHMLAAAALAVP